MNAVDKSEVNTWMYAAIGEVVFIILLIILFIILYNRKGSVKKEKKKAVKEEVPVVKHVKDVYTGPVDNSLVKQENSTETVENTKIVPNTGNPIVDKSVNDVPVVVKSTPMNTNSASSIVENLKPIKNNFQTMPEVNEQK